MPREIIPLCTVSPKGIGWEGKDRVSCQVPWGREGVMAAGEGGRKRNKKSETQRICSGEHRGPWRS